MRKIVIRHEGRSGGKTRKRFNELNEMFNSGKVVIEVGNVAMPEIKSFGASMNSINWFKLVFGVDRAAPETKCQSVSRRVTV